MFKTPASVQYFPRITHRLLYGLAVCVAWHTFPSINLSPISWPLPMASINPDPVDSFKTNYACTFLCIQTVRVYFCCVAPNEMHRECYYYAASEGEWCFRTRISGMLYAVLLCGLANERIENNIIECPSANYVSGACSLQCWHPCIIFYVYRSIYIHEWPQYIWLQVTPWNVYNHHRHFC